MSSSGTPTQALEPVEVTQADEAFAGDIAIAVMVWGRPHFKHTVSFNVLCEAIEPVVARHRQISNAASVGDVGREIHVAGNGQILRVGDVETVVEHLESDPAEASGDAVRLLRFLASLSTEPTDWPKVFADAELVAETVAWRCSPGTNRDGSPKAPARHAIIWQAARLGAIEYAKMTQGDSALSAVEPMADPHPLGQEYDGDALREALANCVGVQSNGGNGGPSFVKVSFRSPNDQNSLYSLISAALSDRPQAEGEVK